MKRPYVEILQFPVKIFEREFLNILSEDFKQKETRIVLHEKCFDSYLQGWFYFYVKKL